MDALALGLSLGLGAGLAPGPLLALIIRTSLERGFPAGARVALAPLVTDVPVVAVSVLLAAALPGALLGVLGIAGGLFVVWLGVDTLRADPVPDDAGPTGDDLRRGALLNVLSPHPWILWITVGAPILAQATIAGALAFLMAFYLVLIGAKVAVAALLAAGRRRLVGGRTAVLAVPGSRPVAVAVGRRRLERDRGFARAVRASGVLLLAAGVVLIAQGARML